MYDRAVRLANQAGLHEAELATIEAIVRAQPTLEEVVRWGLAQDPPRLVVDVIVQDEFTHDVVLPYFGQVHLVYGTT